MATTHVFIVDATTFKFHLEYSFVGTGAKDKRIDFTDSENTVLKYSAENNWISMISDIQRLRKGDFIVFYLQQNVADSILDGKFYGIFKVTNNQSFLDNYDKNQYLAKDIKKSLTFKALIEPNEVYPKGVTEWEALSLLSVSNKKKDKNTWPTWNFWI